MEIHIINLGTVAVGYKIRSLLSRKRKFVLKKYTTDLVEVEDSLPCTVGGSTRGAGLDVSQVDGELLFLFLCHFTGLNGGLSFATFSLPSLSFPKLVENPANQCKVWFSCSVQINGSFDTTDRSRTFTKNLN